MESLERNVFFTWKTLIPPKKRVSSGNNLRYAKKHDAFLSIFYLRGFSSSASKKLALFLQIVRERRSALHILGKSPENPDSSPWHALLQIKRTRYRRTAIATPSFNTDEEQHQVSLSAAQLRELLQDGSVEVESERFLWGQYKAPAGTVAVFIEGQSFDESLPRLKRSNGPATEIIDVATGESVPYWKEREIGKPAVTEEKRVTIDLDVAWMAQQAMFAAASLSRDCGHVEQANEFTRQAQLLLAKAEAATEPKRTFLDAT